MSQKTYTGENILPLFTKKIMKTLFECKGVTFYASEITENTIKIYAKLTKHHGTCPNCKRKSTHQHSVYERKLLDLPISGRKVIIIMQVRKYRCKNPECERKIFAEQNEYIAKRHSRITNRAINLLQNVLVEMSSQKAAFVTSWLKNYPSIKLVARDRASSYANAISTGLPHADQIADKFHIMKNLSEYIVAEIKEHYFKIKRTFLNQMQQQEDYDDRNQDDQPGIAMKYIISPRSKELFNEIHRLTEQGFNGKATAFRYWFHLNFPDYNAKNRIKDVEHKALDKQKGIKISMLAPNSLAIHTVNPEWGVSKKTGECSERHILAEQIIVSSDMLKEMREAYLSFQKVLNGEVVSDLYDWISTHESTSLKHLKSFIHGLHKDINAVCNAIKYKWTNGLVEGEVNRLKNKKRGFCA